MPAYPRYSSDDDADLTRTQAWSPDDSLAVQPRPAADPVAPPTRFTPDYSFAHDSDTAEQRFAARRSAEANSVFASGVWADDEPEEEPVAPGRPPAAGRSVTPSHNASGSRALPPDDERKPKKRRTGLWIGLGSAAAVIVAVVLVISLIVLPLNHAKSDFSTAQANLDQARTTLQDAVTSTQNTVGGVQATDLADPTLLDQYSGLLDQAQTSVATADPTRASSAKAIRQQVTDMTTLATTMTGQAANLTRLSDAVLISKDKAVYLKSKANLTAAVAAAQTVYDSSDGNVDNEDLRTALKTQIDAANAAIAATVADTDLATTATQMDTMAVGLAQADQAVTDSQRSAGGKTYTYTLLASEGQISATQMPADAVILAMKVYVTGSLVEVQTCYQQGGVADLDTCDGYFNGTYYDMTGTRNGDTAVVQDVDPNSLYLWGTITFASTKTQAKVVSFDGPPGLCQLPDGTVFGDPTLPSCGDIAN